MKKYLLLMKLKDIEEKTNVRPNSVKISHVT